MQLRIYRPTISRPSAGPRPWPVWELPQTPTIWCCICWREPISPLGPCIVSTAEGFWDPTTIESLDGPCGPEIRIQVLYPWDRWDRYGVRGEILGVPFLSEYGILVSMEAKVSRATSISWESATWDSSTFRNFTLSNRSPAAA